MEYKSGESVFILGELPSGRLFSGRNSYCNLCNESLSLKNVSQDVVISRVEMSKMHVQSILNLENPDKREGANLCSGNVEMSISVFTNSPSYTVHPTSL